MSDTASMSAIRGGRAGRPPLAKPSPKLPASEVFPPRVLSILDELVAVHDYLIAQGLPTDLVKEMVLHHQSLYLERL